MAGIRCMGGAPPPDYGPAVRKLVFDLGNSCQCYGCRQKIASVLNRLQEGVTQHCYNLEKNQVIVTGTIDPVTVIRKLSKVKKHVRVMLEPSFMDHPPPPQPPGNHCSAPQQPPPPRCHCRGLSAPPPHPPPPCSGPPPPGNHNAPPPPQCTHKQRSLPPPPPHAPDHIHHPPHNCSQAPLLPMKILNSKQPPRCSACGHPPPPCKHGCGHAPPPHKPPAPHQAPHSSALSSNNCASDVLEKVIYGTSSPLIPRNVCPAGILRKLPNNNRLKHVDVFKKKGIKVTFEDDKLKSHHPT